MFDSEGFPHDKLKTEFIMKLATSTRLWISNTLGRFSTLHSSPRRLLANSSLALSFSACDIVANAFPGLVDDNLPSPPSNGATKQGEPPQRDITRQRLRMTRAHLHIGLIKRAKPFHIFKVG
mmetsp:Transcript_11257/g.22656  ORF Transcript_11257/g.22656 Transcript_11257/m.22656 type:complete len:122 (-) Transcript_11257:1830-2195(-)